jgi:hypothetical protein
VNANKAAVKTSASQRVNVSQLLPRRLEPGVIDVRATGNGADVRRDIGWPD